MERRIFNHKDIDRDELEVKEPDPEELERHRGSLLFVVESDDLEPRSVALRPSDVDDLIGALERWRSGVVSTPPADPEPIYTALIRRLVTEEVARVLPLHQAPQAAVPERCGRIAKPGVRLKDKCPDCGYIWMTHPTHPEPDPEPHDVGHAEAPAKPHPTDWSDALFGKAEYEGHGLKFDYCTGCGHGWGTHAHSGELGWHCTAQLGKSACGCNRERS